MQAQQINRIAGRIILVLSLIAFFTVLTGYFQAPQADEGIAAHIFQLAIVALVPTLVLFFVTAGEKKPVVIARALSVPGALVVIAFAALFYLEHYYYR
jgi:heme/copper-type cytochrome/quinol oxidase subunit 4